jgi:hypothetical protein
MKMDVPDFEAMPTGALRAFHYEASGLALELLADLKALHHGEHFDLFWPDCPSPIPDLDAAMSFGSETHDLVGGCSALLMQLHIAEEELALRIYPN